MFWRPRRSVFKALGAEELRAVLAAHQREPPEPLPSDPQDIRQTPITSRSRLNMLRSRRS